VWRSRSVGFLGCCVALALAGCVDAANEVVAPPLAHRRIDRREGVSLAAATVAIVSVEGAPDEIAAAFDKALENEAKSREIVLVDAKKAHFLVRGYLSATAIKDGAALEYVWDVFGRDRSREQRLNDIIEVKGTGDDPWAMASGEALNSVAAKSADDLAAFLSNTSDAKAMPMPAQALSYAPAQ
jgi:hypothetical protein